MLDLDQSMIAHEAARATEIRFMPGFGVFLKLPEGGGMHVPEPLWQTAMHTAQPLWAQAQLRAVTQ